MLVFLGPGFACGWQTRPWNGARPQASWRFESAANDEQGWAGSLDALRDLLDAAGGHARVTIIVSNQFVRYLVLPWETALTRASEQRAFAQHLFGETYADSASERDIRVAPEPPGCPRLASAVECSLIEEVKERIVAAGARIVSLQPYLMYAFNSVRHRDNLNDCWFAVLEPRRACLGLVTGGVWRTILNSRISGNEADEFARVLQLEQVRAAAQGLGSPALVGFRAKQTDYPLASLEGVSLRWVTEDGLAAAFRTSRYHDSLA